MPPDADEDPEPLTDREYVVQELLWIYRTDTAEGVANRLGYASPFNLQRVLARWGHGDLAKLLTYHTLDQNRARP